MKLAVREPESEELELHLDEAAVITSEVAVVEVARACTIALGGEEGIRSAGDLLRNTVLIGLDRSLLERAAALASVGLRTLDAIHLATALEAGPDELVAYDRRLLDAAAEAGLSVSSPGS